MGSEKDISNQFYQLLMTPLYPLVLLNWARNQSNTLNLSQVEKKLHDLISDHSPLNNSVNIKPLPSESRNILDALGMVIILYFHC